MLNAKSGIAEMLQPAGGAGSTRRQSAGNEDSSGLFGATLKGQMDKAAEGQKPAAREAEKPVTAEKRTDSDRAEADPAKPVSMAPEAEEEAATAEASPEDELLADEAAAANSLLLPQPALTEQEIEPAAEGAELLADTAEDGNVLPPALPALAAAGADAALEGAAEGGEPVELPRWMQSLSAVRGRSAGLEQAAAGGDSLLAAEGEDAAPDGGFLKGLQAVAAQLDGQRSDMGGRQGQGQGQGAEALFKLVGLTAAKEAAPPPVGLATSTVSSSVAATAPAAPPAQTLALDVPLRQAGWDQAFSERVVWMARQGVQEAQIHLNPRNMGPIEVHISVQKEQASVAFVAHNAVTREALEAAMPRLRDMLQDNGLNLAQSDVSQQSFEQRRDQAAGFSGEQGGGRQGRGSDTAADEGIMAETPLPGGTGSGMVDYYA